MWCVFVCAGYKLRMDRNTGWIPWILTCFLLNEVRCLQYTPVALNGVGDGECALLLNGPGRSSSFDYNLNLLRGNGFGYNGPHTCITYDAVNAAYLEARKRVQVAQPHGDYKPEDVATVGELLLDISVNLARTYGLSYEDIEKGLPLIDTSRTLIREICPPYLSNVECRPGKYRRLDGLCTNLENPTWGATNTPFTRLIGPLFADGMNAPRISVTGNQLPLSRVVSRTMHPDEGFHDHAGTVMVIAWGQFIDHDYTLTATPLDPLNRNDPEECCKRPPHLRNPYCNEIIIPEDDYFYRLWGVRCMDFVRGFPAARPGCRLGSRTPFNTLTGVLDANTVYGVTEKFSRKLRSGYGGQLRMNPVFREYGLKELLPLKLDIPDEGCTRPNRSMYCFEAGEIRVNEQLVLTCMHTLMAREHNRIAEGLAQVNPHWDDETLFQEARRINIAEVQHITYNEFLPILLGKEVMEKFGLLLQKDGYWDGYDSTVNPNVIDAFAAAAYRFGHSLLPTAVERWSKAHKFIASKRLSDLIRRPYDLYRAGVFDEYFMGLMNQVAQAMDDSITQEVTNHLFKKIGARYGMDLVSFNMQRGREFGIPGYMEFRKFCGLPGADTFGELFGSMPNETIKRYSTIFEHPHDVDLWSGGVSERPLPGSMLGPTFACIIATQFSYSRRGDRFWYELPNQPSSFTPDQLREIRKSRLARVICDNTDLIDTIQLYPMVLPDHEINPRVPCRSGVLPSMDFSKWADHGSPHFQQQQPFIDPDKITDRIINITKEAIHKNIESSLQGESLFKSQPQKKIKILPPLVLTPAVIRSRVAAKNRRKRNAEINIKIDDKIVTGNTLNTSLLPSNSTKLEDQENSTELPIDQVTQAITITQISGTPAPKTKIDNQDLNYQPFVITSSDFKNTSNPNFGEFSNIEEVGKLIERKLEQISQPDNYENEEEDEKEIYPNENENIEEVEENKRKYEEEKENIQKGNEDVEEEEEDKENYEEDDENVEENEEKEVASQREELIQNTEDNDEQNEEIATKNEDPEEKLIIFVPDQPENEEINEDQNEDINEEDREEETQNLEEDQPPEIPESFAKHFIELGAYTPEQETHETKENSEKETDETKENDEQDLRESKQNNEESNKFKTDDETFYLPPEANEEIIEKNKYLDDIISHQLEENSKLQKELEYPELEKEYERFRESASNSYLQSKEADFAEASKPYVIKLRGNFPYEEAEKEAEKKNDGDLEDRREHNYKDDVDVGTDKERLNEEDDESNEQYQDENSAEDNNEEYQQQNEDEEKENYQKDEASEEEENDKVSSQKYYTLIPNEKLQNKLNNLKSWNKRKSKFNLLDEDEMIPSQYILSPSEHVKQNRANYFKKLQKQNKPNNKKHEEKQNNEELTKEETINQEVQVTTENIVDALSKILGKRDSFSRQQEIENPKEYNTFWHLEYRNPNPPK